MMTKPESCTDDEWVDFISNIPRNVDPKDMMRYTWEVYQAGRRSTQMYSTVIDGERVIVVK